MDSQKDRFGTRSDSTAAHHTHATRGDPTATAPNRQISQRPETETRKPQQNTNIKERGERESERVAHGRSKKKREYRIPREMGTQMVS